MDAWAATDASVAKLRAHPRRWDLGPEGSTCKTCKHRLRRVYGSGAAYYYCGQRVSTCQLPARIRLRWPACVLYEAGDGSEQRAD